MEKQSSSSSSTEVRRARRSDFLPDTDFPSARSSDLSSATLSDFGSRRNFAVTLEAPLVLGISLGLMDVAEFGENMSETSCWCFSADLVGVRVEESDDCMVFGGDGLTV